MYGYVKQADGVLKPVLLKNIKNIFQIGNSVNIVYFQVGSTPMEIPRVNQELYFSENRTIACEGTNAAIYTLQDTDFVNGDVKITFGNTHLNILETVTSWVNSILSESNVGKVTLNDFAPSIKVGYVFSNEASMPTAMAMPEQEGEDICDTAVDLIKSKVVFVATDMVANSVPPVHTNIFEANFVEDTRNVSLQPLADGKYILYQFIAATESDAVVDGPAPDVPCSPSYANALSPAMDGKQFIVSVANGAISEIVVCPVVLQATFSPFVEGETFGYTDKCQGKFDTNPGTWPTAKNPIFNEVCTTFGEPVACLSTGDKYNFSEYWIRQEPQGEEQIGNVYANYSVCYERVPDPSVPYSGAEIEIWPDSVPPNYQVIPKDSTDPKSDFVVTPTIESQLSYPHRVYEFIESGAQRPEFGINGINMNVIEIPEIMPVIEGPAPWPGGLIMNGLPVTMDNPYWLADNGYETLLSDGTMEPKDTATPVFWFFGAPSSVNWPPQTALNPTPNTNVNLSYAAMTAPDGSTVNMRCLLAWQDTGMMTPTWDKFFRPQGPSAGCPTGEGSSCDHSLAKYPPYSFLAPSNTIGADVATYSYALAQSSWFQERYSGNISTYGYAYGTIPELVHNVDIYFRDVVNGTPQAWRNYAPQNNQMSTGLPFGMVNNSTYDPNLPPWVENGIHAPTLVLTKPMLIPETNALLLEKGYTHRMFGVGTTWTQQGQGACGCPNNTGDSWYDGGIRCQKQDSIFRGIYYTMSGSAPFESWTPYTTGQRINNLFDAS